MQNKLLPCPFCGGEAIKVAFSWGDISNEYNIECTMCGARTTVLDGEEAIKRWNTRKPMERIVEQLEQLDDDCGCGKIYVWKAVDIVKGGVDNAE